MSYNERMSVGTLTLQPGVLDTKSCSVTKHLEQLYNGHVKPLEELFRFEEYYHNKPVAKGFFNSAPLVLVIGPKNAGKTSFIRQMISSDYPGMVIGDDRSTRVFTLVQSGERDQVIPGDFATLAEDPNLKGLAKLGEDFAKKYCKVTCTAEALDSTWYVDTPRLDQTFEPVELKALKWFAKVAWKIIVLFDATKLRFGNETRDNLSLLFKYRDKMEFIMNKSQTIKVDSLLPQYGIVLTRLHNTFKHRDFDFEPRLYATSFSGFEEEFHPKRPLYKKLSQDSNKIYEILWKSANVGADMKVYQIEKRAKLALNHAEVMLLLREKMSKIARRRGKPDWSSSVRDMLNKIFATLKSTNKSFDDSNIKVENYLQALEEEKFKFSRDRKRLEKVEALIKAGLPLLRKELYGTRNPEEVERKLGRLGLYKGGTRNRRKSRARQVRSEKLRQSSYISTHRTASGRLSRASTSSVISPLPAFNSFTDKPLGTYSVRSESSTPQKMSRNRRRTTRSNMNLTNKTKLLQEKHIDTFSIGSEDVYSNYKRSSRRVRSIHGQPAHTLRTSASVQDEVLHDDPLDLFTNVTDDEFESQNPARKMKARKQKNKGDLEKKLSLPAIKTGLPKERNFSHNSFATQYNVCRVVSRFFNRGEANV